MLIVNGIRRIFHGPRDRDEGQTRLLDSTGVRMLWGVDFGAFQGGLERSNQATVKHHKVEAVIICYGAFDKY
jgi:hypothetical protein